MKTLPRSSSLYKLAKQIALASMRPCPEISPARVAVRIADGFEFSPWGSIPWPARIESRGFCYFDKRSNTYFGRRFETEQAAEFAWQYAQMRNAVRFLQELRKMSASELRAQADFWLKNAAQC